MIFTEEDLVLTATEAAEMSYRGVDDSEDRELFRSAMRLVRFQAYYGYRSCSLIIGLGKDMSSSVKTSLEGLGYTVDPDHVPGDDGKPPFLRYTISW